MERNYYPSSLIAYAYAQVIRLPGGKPRKPPQATFEYLTENLGVEMTWAQFWREWRVGPARGYVSLMDELKEIEDRVSAFLPV